MFKEFQDSIGSIQRIASLLSKDDMDGLNKFTHSDTCLHSLAIQNIATAKFHSLHLPADLGKVRAISHPSVRAHVLANLINRDQIALETLHLSKKELMEIAPFLTFVHCTRLFESTIWKLYSNWKNEEIQAFIDKCTNATTLLVSTPGITRLPDLPKCELLMVNSCINLEILPPLPKCKYLYCAGCHNLKALTNLNVQDLFVLYCNNCSKLEKISGSALEVNCWECPELKHIMGFEGARKIICNDCPKLERIIGPEDVRELNCNHCPELIQVPRHVMQISSGISFEHEGCEKLFRRGRVMPMPVFMDRLQNYPTAVLDDVADQVTRQRWSPIQFIEQDGRVAEGIDAGGLSRILVTHLVKRLISSVDENAEFRLPCEKEDLGAMPIWKHDDEDLTQLNNYKNFENLGALFLFCMVKNAAIGNAFSPELFRMIASYRPEDLLNIRTYRELYRLPLDEVGTLNISDELRLQLLASDSGGILYEVANILKKSPAELTKSDMNVLMKIGNEGALFEELSEDEYLKLSGVKTQKEALELEEVPLKFKEYAHAALKEYILEMSKNRDVVLPAALIARAILDNSWCQLYEVYDILRIPPDKLTKEMIKQLLEIGSEWGLFKKLEDEEFLFSLLGIQIDEFMEMEEFPLQFKEYVHSAIGVHIKERILKNPVEFRPIMFKRIMSKLPKLLQGVITKKAVLDAIEWPEPREGLDPDAAYKTKEYIETWINQATTEELENFLFVLSGSPALPVNKKLEMHFYHSDDPERYPSVHTCSFQMNMPVNYPDYQHFKAKWEDMIKQSTNLEHSGSEEI